MAVSAYKTRPGYLYIPCKRGDSILAPDKPKQLRLFDGMCGGYIDPADWDKPPVISAYNQGETLWIEVPKSSPVLKFAQDAGKPENDSQQGTIPPNYRRMTNWIDFKTLAPYVESQCPDFLTKVYQHKYQIPVISLNSIDASCIKDSQLITPTRSLIDDVGQITSGDYTVGSDGGDDYPTYGGAGGLFAAFGNLTGNLTGALNSAITETASAQATISLGGNTLEFNSNSAHGGDPTAGYLISCNFTASNYFDFQQEGAGTTNILGYRIKWTGTANAGNNIIIIAAIGTACTINIYDLMFDGDSKSNAGIYVFDDTPILNIYNNVIWDNGSHGLIVQSAKGNASNLYENNVFYANGGYGVEHVNNGGTFRNNAAYGNTSGDFNRIGNATGNNNVSSDATAADGNWSSGSNNQTNNTVGNDVESTTDTESDFFDITPSGALDGAGTANGIAARTTGIRGRAVTSPPSIGAAEAADTVSVPVIMNTLRLRQS